SAEFILPVCSVTHSRSISASDARVQGHFGCMKNKTVGRSAASLRLVFAGQRPMDTAASAGSLRNSSPGSVQQPKPIATTHETIANESSTLSRNLLLTGGD